MNLPPAPHPYTRQRFPAEIISHCVWLYVRFCLSYRDVEERMAERGILLTYEAVRDWCRKFGRASANQVRPRRHLLSAPEDRQQMAQRFQTWREITGTAVAAYGVSEV